MTLSAGGNWQHASSPTTELQGNALNDSASGPYKVNSRRIDPAADPMNGSVIWDPSRSIWNGSMLAAAVVFGPQYFTWAAFFVYCCSS